MLELEDLLECPFKIRGRDRNGFDCYGLVIEVEKRLGHTMKDYCSEYTNDNCESVINANYKDFVVDMGMIETDNPKLGDVIVFMNDNGKSVHVGVYLKRDDFIHCDGSGVHIEKLNRYFRNKRKVYTWQN